MPRLIPVALALVASLLTACVQRAEEPGLVRPASERVHEVDVEYEAARAILLRASPAVAAEALRHLETRHYTVDVAFRELDTDGALSRRWRRQIDRVPRADRDGDQTLLGEVLAGQGGAVALLRFIDPVEILLPAAPPYLKDGNSDYVIQLLPVRVIGGRRVIGAQASRRPGVDEPILVVRSWVDAVTSEPVRLELVRASSSILLTEEAHVEVTLGPASDDALLPLAARIDASVDMLAEGPRRFVIDLAMGTKPMRKS